MSEQASLRSGYITEEVWDGMGGAEGELRHEGDRGRRPGGELSQDAATSSRQRWGPMMV